MLGHFGTFNETFCQNMRKRGHMEQGLNHIVVVDDDNEMRSLLSDFLGESGFKVSSFHLATEAIRYLKSLESQNEKVDLVISDINMPEMTGIDLIRNISRTQPDLPIILITAFGSVETAIEAMRVGAFDYVVKPFQLAEIKVSIDRALRFRKLQKDNQSLRQEVKKSWNFKNIIGKSPAMKQVLDLIPKISNAKTNVLITGASGTGKEVIAKSIHDSGNRSQKPFVAINCSAIPENLLESELFGHAKGSFTGAINDKKGLFEEAEGGTLFLDEIGDMDLSLQAKLLRVLQERKIKSVGENKYKDIDVRIIAATHKDLRKMISEASFREDLFYRLSVLPISLPELKERREDIPALANHFVQKYSAMNNTIADQLSQKALSILISRNWDGNVRELENIIERAVVLCPNKIIDESYFIENSSSNSNGFENFFEENTENMPSLEDLEKKYIKLVLDKTGNRKEKAANILGINRRTLYRKERLYGFVQENDEYVN